VAEAIRPDLPPRRKLRIVGIALVVAALLVAILLTIHLMK